MEVQMNPILKNHQLQLEVIMKMDRQILKLVKIILDLVKVVIRSLTQILMHLILETLVTLTRTNLPTQVKVTLKPDPPHLS